MVATEATLTPTPGNDDNPTGTTGSDPRPWSKRGPATLNMNQLSRRVRGLDKKLVNLKPVTVQSMHRIDAALKASLTALQEQWTNIHNNHKEALEMTTEIEQDIDAHLDKIIEAIASNTRALSRLTRSSRTLAKQIAKSGTATAQQRVRMRNLAKTISDTNTCLETLLHMAQQS